MSVLYNLCSADGNGFTFNLSFPSVCYFNNLTGIFMALISHTVAQGKIYWGNCLYMPCEVYFWGSLLPDCYIVTNISMLCLGKTNLCVCVYTWACPLCPCEHSDSSLGYLSGTLQCRYDYTEISTVPKEDTKQYSLRFTLFSYPLLPTSS